jgi:hypothetical protein
MVRCLIDDYEIARKPNVFEYEFNGVDFFYKYKSHFLRRNTKLFIICNIVGQNQDVQQVDKKTKDVPLAAVSPGHH